MAIHRLTAAAVRKADKRGLYSDGGGLALQVARNGSRSWIFRYRVGARDRYLGLGPLADVSLAQAREAARECRELRRQGTDPIEHRKAERAKAELERAKTKTFDEAVEEFLDSHSISWRN